MEKYQLRVQSTESFLYGGKDVQFGNGEVAPVMIVRNDEFGEPIKLVAVKKKPTQPEELIEFGTLQPSEVLTFDLRHVIRVGARCLEANADSLVFCTIITRAAQ